MKTIILIQLALLLSAACNDQKKADTTATVTSDSIISEPTTQNIDTMENIPSEKPVKPVVQDPPSPTKPKEPVAAKPNEYRVVISFISKASGVDRALHPKFKEFLATYSPSVTPDITPWGREGEVDYCMKLNELTQKQQKDFIQKVRNMMGDTDMVFIKENAQCVHKR